MVLVQQIFEHLCSTCYFCFRVNWCLWGQDLILNRMCLWYIWGNRGTSSLWDSFFLPLVTFRLFAVVSVLLQLGPFCLLLMLPLLCVFWINRGRVWPEGDDDAGHVVTSCPVSRCVWGQTVVQQLSRDMWDLKLKMHEQCLGVNLGHKLDRIVTTQQFKI